MYKKKDCIYLVTVLEVSKHFTVEVINKRCVGWFNNFDLADSSIKVNCGDISEFGEYVVLECSTPDLFSLTEVIRWYKYDPKFNQFSKCDALIGYESQSNFGIG